MCPLPVSYIANDLNFIISEKKGESKSERVRESKGESKRPRQRREKERNTAKQPASRPM